jgi:hypothetical protein
MERVAVVIVVGVAGVVGNERCIGWKVRVGVVRREENDLDVGCCVNWEILNSWQKQLLVYMNSSLVFV